jgi:FkbM family methyltransferase
MIEQARPTIPLPIGSDRSNDHYIRTEPLSRKFGLDIGHSIARHYIDEFIASHRDLIRGRVLEIGDNHYTRTFGSNVTESFVLTADATAGDAIEGDLASGRNVPSEFFDCFICTQTLQCIFEMEQALCNSVGCLAPGGTLLLTVSGISQISRYDFERWGEYWRYTTEGIESLFRKIAPEADIKVSSRGNLAAAQAYLDGCPVERLSDDVLKIDDPDYQLIVTAAIKLPEPPAVEPISLMPENLAALRQMTNQKRDYLVKLKDLTIQTNSLPSLASEYELIFQRGIYDFEAVRGDPYVIDGGAHIGAFSLYTMMKYPLSTIVAFEPEKKSWRHLKANLQRNLTSEQHSRITSVNNGLAHYNGEMPFDARDADGSTAFSATTNSSIRVCRLLPYLDRPVDYLKLNIEGLELEVLRDIEPGLHLIRELCLEYHGFSEVGQRLHDILDLLHRNGFRYIINDLGQYFNPACQPPFRISADTRYYLLVYARRLQDTPQPL